MKTSQISLFLAEALLIGTAIAQPHRHHAHNVQKRNVIVTATIEEYVNAPDVIVYVDENGNPIAAPAATPAPAPVVVPAPVPAAPTPAPAPPAPAPAPPAPAPAPPAPAAPAPQPAAPVVEAPAPPVVQAPAAPSTDVQTNNFVAESSAGAQDGFIDNGPSPYGVTWTGYKGDESNSACKTFEDAEREWSQMGAFKTVRTYGTDCDQPNIALTLAKKHQKKVFLGLYWLDGRLDSQLQTIIEAVKVNDNNWGIVDSIAIGNEDVHRGGDANQVISAVATSRRVLRAAGYRGAIVHVDSQDAILANPVLCTRAAGDYIAANIHAFFNPNTPAEQAGDFVAHQVDALRACGANRKRRNVRVRVTETGWPKNGVANGVAVPSKENQMKAIASIKAKMGNDVFLFSAFNNYWMRNSEGTFNAEKFWGILDG